jgi:two-component system response regulator RstA
VRSIVALAFDPARSLVPTLLGMKPGERPRVLLVEDDRKLARLVREYLVANGLSVSIEERGDTAVGVIREGDWDLVILDIMLPGRDGLSVCREVRPRYRGPILMLTARADEVDEIVGLEIGADDYLTKPVSPRLLLARVSALLRRITGNGASAEVGGPGGKAPSRLVIGELVVDGPARRVEVAGKAVVLTTAEFDLLYLLASHPGQILTRERMFQELRGIEWDGSDRSIDTRVVRLRRKLGDVGCEHRYIKSIRGAGYLLVPES